MPDLSWHPEPELIDVRDPERSRAALEELGEAMWTEALDWLYRHALARPTSALAYPELRKEFFGESGRPGPPPAVGRPSRDVLAEFRVRLAPHLYGSQHPGQFGFFTPPPLAMGIVGETLAQWANQGIDLWMPGMAGPFVEEEVVAWIAELVGMGSEGWGVLTSGGAMANVLGLTVARDVHLAKLLGADGPPRGAALERVRAYASDQAHVSISRGLDLLGFPAGTLRVVPSDERFRLLAEPVAQAIAEDRDAGMVPWLVTPVAGSTNTGSVDLIGELADLAEREGLWLHVDAAYGGAARLSPRDAGRVPDLERADSITIDPHKWFFQPYDIGALLVQRRAHLETTFGHEPEYYRTIAPEDEPLHWYRYSFETTRRFRALKLWLSWKHLGTAGFAQLVEHNDDLAAYLAERVRVAPDLEGALEAPELSVVCFRHLPGGPEAAQALPPEELDAHQDRIQRALEVSGAGWVSTTKLRGRTWLRAGIVNYLATEADVDRVLEELRRAGRAA